MAAVKVALLSTLLFLVGCSVAGNGVCNRNSNAHCKGEWVGTECPPAGRGYTCTDNGNGGILTPECSCLDGQGNPPPTMEVEVDTTFFEQ